MEMSYLNNSCGEINPAQYTWRLKEQRNIDKQSTSVNYLLKQSSGGTGYITRIGGYGSPGKGIYEKLLCTHRLT